MEKRVNQFILISFAFYFSSCSEPTTSDKASEKLEPVNELAASNAIERGTQKIIDSLQTELQKHEIKFRSLEEASTGEFVEIESAKENEVYGFSYRAEIYLSEIYKSLYLTKIEYQGEGSQRIESTYHIDLDKELGISGEQTTDLQFVNWNSPSEFDIEVNGKAYSVKVVSVKEVKIKEKLPTTTPKRQSRPTASPAV
jgi:hypothetical protein